MKCRLAPIAIAECYCKKRVIPLDVTALSRPRPDIAAQKGLRIARCLSADCLMNRIAVVIAAVCLLFVGAHDASAQPVGGGLRISWEVKNRFRLFREEKDFLLHADALRGRTILESEQELARLSEGRGWARNMLGRLCIDASGKIASPCNREGAEENYLAPADHRVGVRLFGADDASCAWRFDNGETPTQTATTPCAEEIKLYARANRITTANVEVTYPDGHTDTQSADIEVRDLLIAGLGDSIAAGEGNPDKPVALSDEGFCFRQFVGTTRSEYFRPGRAGFKGDKSCELAHVAPGETEAWTKLSARWQNAACHRSLYSYQLRTALALAVEQTHIAVTFLPLACTGATIAEGLLGPQRARELDCGDRKCPATVPAQVSRLGDLIKQAQRDDPSRNLDLILLTVGANDIDFSGLVADIIIQEPWARALFKRSGILGSVAASQDALDSELPGNFAKLRTALKPLMRGDLGRVIYVPYAHPALNQDGPCPSSRAGFDVHPAFAIDGERLNRAAAFVEGRFLPALRALATCTGGTLCKDAAKDRMTLADAHQAAFIGHGVCARATSDPPFDNECFSADGNSFKTSLTAAASDPLTCGRPASEFRAYASRARWVRTANDSYFAAMTYPQGFSTTLQPSDIHDATWGILSAVYGGAIHPTAEGHAAMADAALTEARRVLGLVPPDAEISAAPLPAPPAQSAP
jgi:hypothetical protein